MLKTYKITIFEEGRVRKEEWPDTDMTIEQVASFYDHGGDVVKTEAREGYLSTTYTVEHSFYWTVEVREV